MSLQLTVMSLDFDSLIPPITKKFSKREITIGRLPSNDIVLDTPEVSGHHAKLRIVTNSETPKLFITDLGSTNGTLVENVPVAHQIEVPLSTNERVRIGNYLIKPLIVGDEFELLAEDPILEETITEFTHSEIEDEEETEGLYVTRAKTHVLDKASLRPLPQENGHPANAARELYVDPEEPAHRTPPVAHLESGAAIIKGRAGASPAKVDFVASMLVALRGTVLHRGFPLAGATVDAGPLGTAVTSDDGAFTFADIIEGTSYTLSVTKDQFRFDGEFEGVLEQDTALEISAQQLFTISGVVTHKGSPLGGATVDGGPLGTVLTAPDGSYHFYDVPEDTEYELHVYKEGYVIGAAE